MHNLVLTITLIPPLGRLGSGKRLKECSWLNFCAVTNDLLLLNCGVRCYSEVSDIRVEIELLHASDSAIKALS